MGPSIRSFRDTAVTILLLNLVALALGLLSNMFAAQPLALFTPLPSLLPGDISTQTAFELFQSQKAEFLDVRSETDYERSHILGAKRYARHGSLEEVLWITYCSGPRCPKAQVVARKLRARGHEVVVFHAGFEAWVQAGYPTNSGPNP